ncbi:MAG: DUF222 domain-containing protein, partial [Actinobacteria bacterium]|nr:DUF222 domain-containing protein [Actinomycetota bacterium]
MFDSAFSDLTKLSADPLERGAALLAMRRELDAELVETIGALAVNKTTNAVLGLSTREWVSSTGDTSNRTANRLIAVGKAVASKFAPDVLQRVRDGKVGVDHLEVIVRWSNPRIEPEWSECAGVMLDAADGMTFTAWERYIAGLAEHLDEDGPFDPENDKLRNRLRVKYRGASLHLEGEFYGDVAESLLAGIEAMNQKIFEQFWSDHQLADIPMPSQATMSALALHELVRLGHLFRADGSPRPGAAEASFIVQLEDDKPTVRSLDGRVLYERDFGRLLCDPDVRAVVLDSLGQPLDVGRVQRLATKEMRAALRARDGGCVFPGCTCDAAELEAHHVQHWTKGGMTACENLLLLCRRHHGVIHRIGWALFITNDGWAVFTRPDGLSMWGQRHGVRRTGDLPELPERPTTDCTRPRSGEQFDIKTSVDRTMFKRAQQTARESTRIAHAGWGGGNRRR